MSQNKRKPSPIIRRSPFTDFNPSTPFNPFTPATHPPEDCIRCGFLISDHNHDDGDEFYNCPSPRTRNGYTVDHQQKYDDVFSDVVRETTFSLLPSQVSEIAEKHEVSEAMVENCFITFTEDAIDNALDNARHGTYEVSQSKLTYKDFAPPDLQRRAFLMGTADEDSTLQHLKQNSAYDRNLLGIMLSYLDGLNKTINFQPECFRCGDKINKDKYVCDDCREETMNYFYHICDGIQWGNHVYLFNLESGNDLSDFLSDKPYLMRNWELEFKDNNIKCLVGSFSCFEITEDDETLRKLYHAFKCILG